MSELIKAIEDFKAAMRRLARAKTAVEKDRAEKDLTDAFNRIVSAATRSTTWTDEEHAAFDAFTAEYER